jgi:hypothetical protein
VFWPCYPLLISASYSYYFAGEEFLEGMLVDGWLLKLVRVDGSVEDSIASWTLTKCKELFLNSV